MNQRPRQKSRRRSGGQGQPQQQVRPLGLWTPVSPLPALQQVTPPADPTATIRSLGQPPLHNRDAEHYLAAAVRRAAILATGLASSAGVLAEPEPE